MFDSLQPFLLPCRTIRTTRGGNPGPPRRPWCTRHTRTTRKARTSGTVGPARILRILQLGRRQPRSELHSAGRKRAKQLQGTLKICSNSITILWYIPTFINNNAVSVRSMCCNLQPGFTNPKLVFDYFPSVAYTAWFISSPHPKF